MQTCRDCGVRKRDRLLAVQRKKYINWCRECRNKYNREWEKAHPDRRGRYTAEDWKRIQNERRKKRPIASLLKGSRSNSKKRGQEHTITETDLHIPECCPLLGIKLDSSLPLRAHGLPSLDRIDNSKGYVPGNVWIISFYANRLKSDATLEQMKMLVTNWEE